MVQKQITWMSNTVHNSKAELNCQLFLLGLYFVLLLVSVSTMHH